MQKTLLLFLLLFSMSSFGQMITGKIIIDDPIEGYDQLHGIQIENLRNNAKTQSNQNGLFSIKVETNDVVQISSDWTKERQIKILPEMIKRGYFEVNLNINLIELDEVRLHSVSKVLKDNVKPTDDAIINLYRNLGLDPRLRDIKVNPYSSSMVNSGGILDPIALIGTLTGYRKKMQRQYNYFRHADQIDALILYLTVDYYVEFLKIPEHKIRQFTEYVIDTRSLKNQLKASQYEIIRENLYQEASNFLALILNESMPAD